VTAGRVRSPRRGLQYATSCSRLAVWRWQLSPPGPWWHRKALPKLTGCYDITAKDLLTEDLVGSGLEQDDAGPIELTPASCDSPPPIPVDVMLPITRSVELEGGLAITLGEPLPETPGTTPDRFTYKHVTGRTTGPFAGTDSISVGLVEQWGVTQIRLHYTDPGAYSNAQTRLRRAYGAHPHPAIGAGGCKRAHRLLRHYRRRMVCAGVRTKGTGSPVRAPAERLSRLRASVQDRVRGAVRAQRPGLSFQEVHSRAYTVSRTRRSRMTRSTLPSAPVTRGCESVRTVRSMAGPAARPPLSTTAEDGSTRDPLS